MEIIISNSSEKPLYEQITSQIKEMIISGELHPGEAMPSIRKLAKDLRISVITVQKAYDDLQKQGFIDSVVGRGSFVSAFNREFILEEQQKKIEDHMAKAVEAAKASRVSYDQLIDLLKILYFED